MMKILAASVTAAVVLSATVTLTLAGGHSPIEQRKAAMKTVGGSSKTIGDMVKGTTEFDAAKAGAALVAAREAVEGFEDLFPEGSETGFETTAKETIWTARADFDAKMTKFKADLDAAIAAAPDTPEAVAAQFGMIGKNCGSCHETYRVKK